MNDTKKAMKFHRDQLQKLKKSGAPKNVLDKEKKRIKDLRSGYSMAQQYEFASKMGTFEGNWNTAKDLFVDGNLLS